MKNLLIATLLMMVNVAQADVSAALNIESMTCLGEGEDDRQIGLLIEPAKIPGIRDAMLVTVSRMNKHEKDPAAFLTPPVRIASEGTGLQVVHFANGYNLLLDKGDLNEILEHATTGRRKKDYYEFTGRVRFQGEDYKLYSCDISLK